LNRVLAETWEENREKNVEMEREREKERERDRLFVLSNMSVKFGLCRAT
jgi:hypothetical protein